ncbi:MAG: ribosome biogenesis GTPase Der [Christensenellales bacterium]
MKRPLVAIVGRPNVGKSTFFNRVCGKRISIVKDMPGVTRDRIYGDAEWCGNLFSLVDTGGLDFGSDDEISRHIINQAQIAVDLAEVILFFVDGRGGLTNSDREVADFLRKSGKPIVLVVNKLDNNEVENSYEFYELQLGVPFPISSEHGKGIGDVLDEVVKMLKTIVKDGEESDVVKIAIVGKPNAGKSSITNKLLGSNRMVVSDIAGTTRDAIDSPFTYNGKDYIIIDTAGMRRKSQIEEDSVEAYSVLRAIESIRRADVVLFVLDASQGITDQDQKIASLVHEEGKPSVFIVNKWDKIEKNHKTMNEFDKNLSLDFTFMDYAKVIYISALTGQRLNQIMPAVNEVYANAGKKISMGVLNTIVADAVASSPPPAVSGKRLKIAYVTQSAVYPPKFLFFVNDEMLVQETYKRYLENRIRASFDFTGTPIKLLFRNNYEKNN